MFATALRHAIEAIRDAPLHEAPFPYVYVEGVFPEEFYATLQRNMPLHERYRRLVDTGRVGRKYSFERLVLQPGPEAFSALPDAQAEFWRGLFAALLEEQFARAVMEKFATAVLNRLRQEGCGDRVSLDVSWEAFLIRDLGAYQLGPHTDSPRKLVSMLFYLPAEDSDAGLGTSLYRPKHPEFTCPGGPHHRFDRFERLHTVAYRPNTMFAFPKTHNCFHGVEPVPEGAIRDLLFYDICQRYPG